MKMPKVELPKGLTVAGPTHPNPGEKAPHQDAGELIYGFLSDVQGAGETACSALDKPMDASIKVKGPHRLADGVLALGLDVVKDAIKKITR